MLADYDAGRNRTANGTLTDIKRDVRVEWSGGAGGSSPSHAVSRTTFVYSYEFRVGDALYSKSVSVTRTGNVPSVAEYPGRGESLEILYDPANVERNVPLIWARDVAGTNYNFDYVVIAVIFAGFVTLTLFVVKPKRQKF
jgi:hypothetical protein